MRFLFCKIHCPFICFCKPSPRIYRAGPLKLENSPHASSTAVVSVSNESSNDHLPDESVVVKEKSFDAVDGKQSQAQSGVKKSCLKKVHLDSNSEEIEKKKVQWLDFLGKELVEIREIESREIEDREYDDDESNSRCLCKFLGHASLRVACEHFCVPKRGCVNT